MLSCGPVTALPRQCLCVHNASVKVSERDVKRWVVCILSDTLGKFIKVSVLGRCPANQHCSKTWEAVEIGYTITGFRVVDFQCCNRLLLVRFQRIQPSLDYMRPDRKGVYLEGHFSSLGVGLAAHSEKLEFRLVRADLDHAHRSIFRNVDAVIFAPKNISVDLVSD